MLDDPMSKNRQKIAKPLRPVRLPSTGGFDRPLLAATANFPLLKAFKSAILPRIHRGSGE
jgi:hypothetical protein